MSAVPPALTVFVPLSERPARTSIGTRPPAITRTPLLNRTPLLTPWTDAKEKQDGDRGAPSPTTPGGSRPMKFPLPRLKLIHVLILLGVYSVYLFILRPRRPQRPISTTMSFCPFSTPRKHIPTVILQGDGHNDRNELRTYWVGGRHPAKFLPYSYPPRDLRISQTIMGGSASRPVAHHRAAAGGLGAGGKLGHLTTTDREMDEGVQLCSIHRVPSSPPPVVPSTWSNHKVMFGMATTPDRVLYNLPVWTHWLPSSPRPLDPTFFSATKDLPLLLILTPPTNPTEQARVTEALEEGQVHGMFLKMRSREADRFETRYFGLAEEMWKEAQLREQKSGIKTEWFVFSDDDTFFPDFKSLVRMLSSYDSSKHVIIGALSESTHQVSQWGHLAYGGAGIYVSRALVEKMNAGGNWQDCLNKYGASFGGDAMITNCAAVVQGKTPQEALTLDDTLHQLDIRGDGTGFFQSGFLITSLHHWGSWFSLFPPWHETGSGDLRHGITLVGKAAMAVGGDNWGRRYIFEDGKVSVNLGYSVTVELKALTESELDRSEHTWWEFVTFHAIRPGLVEGSDKRTYYLTGVRVLEHGVARLEHKNREGERVDIIWDGRGEKNGAWGMEGVMESLRM